VSIHRLIVLTIPVKFNRAGILILNNLIFMSIIVVVVVIISMEGVEISIGLVETLSEGVWSKGNTG
jgi:hypothetical protein